MASEWSAALLAAGAVGSATTGVWVLVKIAPNAQRIKRRVNHERVRVPIARETTDRMATLLPALAGGVLMYFFTQLMTGKAGLSFFVAMGSFMIPTWIREWRETRRLTVLADQLGRVMGMVSTGLRRGTPLEAALSESAMTIPFPLGPVLRNMADATVLGVTLSQAVEQSRQHPAVRGSTDFQVFATEMVVCHERGANVVQAFEALRAVLAARRKYREQVREHMGQHLIQSLVISGVGLGVLLAYSQMTPDGLGPLLESVIGQMILAGCILANVFLIRLTHLTMLRQTRRV